MVFESLSSRLQDVLSRLRGRGKLSESDVDEALREVRIALLEADVNYKVVKDFVKRVRERAVGQEVLRSLTPGQHVIKIVNEELTMLMGGSQSRISVAPRPPTIILMVGLQGSGKTTASAKLAALLKKQGHRPVIAACDVYRPAAIKQLEVLGGKLDIPVFSMGDRAKPVDIARAALEHGISRTYDYLIIDTAGRLHVDEELMDELGDIKAAVNPTEILLVVDAMTGQDAVNVAQAFNERLAVDGVVLTKLDGDARGGAALSIRAVTGRPIKFVGLGERVDSDTLEPFHPDRMASRILGMGDVLSLIEKAQASIDEEKAKRLEEKLRKADFTLEDFMDQMSQLKRMGPLNDILGMIPGLSSSKALKELRVDEKHLARLEAIINSMTIQERRNPQIIDSGRKRRIAAGSGTRVQDINNLLKQFEETRRMLKRFGNLDKGFNLGKRMKLPFRLR